MAKVLRGSDPGFQDEFDRMVRSRRDQPADVQAAVREIIEGVRTGGDAALAAYTARFDGIDPAASGFAFARHELANAYDSLAPDLRAALTLAHERIEAHHRRQMPANDRYRDGTGVELGHRWTPLDAVGLYVPGGKASYPSSVLMNAVPAKVAGVPRLVMVVPTPRGDVSDAVLAAAYLAGVDEVYRVGGAQAIAALAYGTESIAPVAKIVGPGNAYVAEAKRQVFGTVGIDMIAGPSEVVVVAGEGMDPRWIAADLLAQAEHDEAAQAILITDSTALAEAATLAVERQLASMPRGPIARASWDSNGAVIIVENLVRDAPSLIDALAPEHLELACDAAETLVPLVRHAGAIFIGPHTPEAVGDYVAGTNHVLPTARAARFSSGLNVLDFMKRTSLLKLSPDSLSALGPATMALAVAEGLDAHRRSVAVRLGEDG